MISLGEEDHPSHLPHFLPRPPCRPHLLCLPNFHLDPLVLMNLQRPSCFIKNALVHLMQSSGDFLIDALLETALHGGHRHLKALLADKFIFVSSESYNEL